MKEKIKKKHKASILSRDPYKRRGEAEMVRIICEIQGGMISKRAACKKYGLNRNTLAHWMSRLSVRNLEEQLPNQLFSGMTEDQKIKALYKKIKELTQALEQAKLESNSLQTMIQVAEEELHIKIRKKRGTKQFNK
jgi:hypothetical protein